MPTVSFNKYTSSSLNRNQITRLIYQRMPRPASSNGPKRGKAPKAHKLAEQFPQGTLLKDNQKKEWKLGQIIGQGGFGRIYIASSNSDTQVTDKTANSVVKIEPMSNGPLYCEMQFYIRAAQPSQIESYVSAKKLKYLSVPRYLGSGMHTLNSQTYRFLVIPRFGTDLHKILINSGGTFPEPTVFVVGLRMIDALQYLHEKGFVHADIKASNILLGYQAGKEISNEVYLCDFGLAYKYTVNGDHREYKEDPKKAHDGTIEFTSRDAHKGVSPARRGDLEILAYCMLQWLYGKLPWEDRLNDPNYVAEQKNQCMDNIKSFIKDCLQGRKSPASDTILKYLELVCQLDYEEEPNYDHIKALLKTGLSKCGQKDEWKIEFSAKPKTLKRKSRDYSPVISPKQSKVASPKKPASSPKKKPKASPKQSKVAAPKKPASSPKKKPIASPKQSKVAAPKKPASSPKKKPIASPSTAAKAKGKKSPSSVKARGKASPALKAVPKRNGVHTKSPAKSNVLQTTQTSKTYQIPPPTKPETNSKFKATTTQMPPPSKPPPKATQLPPPSKSNTSSRSAIVPMPPPSKMLPGAKSTQIVPFSKQIPPKSQPPQIPPKSKPRQIPPPSKPHQR